MPSMLAVCCSELALSAVPVVGSARRERELRPPLAAGSRRNADAGAVGTAIAELDEACAEGAHRAVGDRRWFFARPTIPHMGESTLEDPNYKL